MYRYKFVLLVLKDILKINIRSEVLSLITEYCGVGYRDDSVNAKSMLNLLINQSMNSVTDFELNGFTFRQQINLFDRIYNLFTNEDLPRNNNRINTIITSILNSKIY